MSSHTGFNLSWLRLTGPDLEPAQIDFRPGLNVVWGASETGKSFIFSCIDFMLGAETPPKNIDELKGYITVHLAITDHAGNQHVLERGLQGGSFRHFDATGDDWTLSNPQVLFPAHDPARTDTISYLLLSAAGIEKAVILTGIGKGETGQLSFRDVAHMTLIDEERIIAGRSPIYPSGQYGKETREMAIFTHLISGTEWSGVIAQPDIKLEKATWRGKSDLYVQLIGELTREASENQLTLEELESRIAETDRVIAEVSSKIEESSRIIANTMVSRKAAWEGAQKIRSRIIMIEQLRERFELLHRHYQSDLSRLQFISEGDFFLAQLGAPHCPFCGEVLSDHAADQLAEEAGKASIQEATTEEARKIEANVRDLEKTLSSLANEQELLNADIRLQQELLSQADSTIRHELEPRLTIDRNELAALVATRTALFSKQFVQQRLDQMTARFAALGKEPKRKKVNTTKVSPNPDPEHFRLFANEIADVLTNWRYLKSGVVDFDDQMDVVVAGQPRRNHGKGIRAVLHSAFTIAIMNHCAKQKLKHSGLVLLDSPLTSFKENDHYAVDDDIQIGFFTTLLNLPERQQVIVFENKKPPIELLGALRHTHFSGTAGVGRKGFIPERIGLEHKIQPAAARAREATDGSRAGEP